ncbi:hypothetical protein GEMRC1_014205 [Eukaryota sp. GEM-RC1]
MENNIPHEPLSFRELTPTPIDFESDIKLTSSVQWYWQDDSGFKPYSKEMSRQIESQYSKFQENQAESSFVVSEIVRSNNDLPQSYTIDFVSNEQINNTNSKVTIKRELVSVTLNNQGVWYFKENSSWTRYDILCQVQIEQAFSNYIKGISSSVISLTFPGHPETYLLDFSQGTQTSTTSGCVRSTKREEGDEVSEVPTFHFKIDSLTEKSDQELLKGINSRLLEMIIKENNVSTASESDFDLSFDKAKSTFILTLDPSLSTISSILFSVVFQSLKSQGLSVSVQEDKANDGISNRRLRNLLSGIVPTKMNRDGVMQYLAHKLIWNCNWTIYGGYVRDFIIRNWRANDIDVVVSSTQSFDTIIEDFKRELRLSNFNPVFRDLPRDNDLCKSIEINIGIYQIQVDFTFPGTSRQFDNSAPPYVEADVSNFIVNKTGLGFKEPEVQEEKGISLKTAIEHAINQEFVFFYNLNQYPALKYRLKKISSRGFVCLSKVPDHCLDLFGDLPSPFYRPLMPS